ncbi:MAG TPA: hypothetical protein VLU43_01325 [Anaeromyxobacteraceae bacterium]|nr:hypothetical protein [Anaeromyxobacteraceae bacterium]
MSRSSALVALLALLAATPAHAQQVVSKKDWLEAMKTALPTAFCAAGMPFRTCFDVTQEQCEDAAASAARVCLKKFEGEIPDRLRQPEDGKKWGEKVGQCAGNTYSIALAQKKVKSKECE